MGKYRQATDYFNKIIASNPGFTDYLNAGHVQLAMGNTQEAIHLYALSWKNSKQSPAEFTDAFSIDIPDLLDAGIKEKDIPFIIDSIFYTIE
jgi:tetratricopeptide (TPR) repeat protein